MHQNSRKISWWRFFKVPLFYKICMTMGVVRTMYSQDSDERDLFFAFKKAYEERQEILIQALTQWDKTHIIQTAQWDILCSLQQCHGSDVVHHSYGHQYHILLEKDGKRDACNIEHRFHPYEESWKLNGYSRLVNTQKHWVQHQYEPKEENSIENTIENTMLG